VTWRTNATDGRKLVHVEPARIDEQPVGVAALEPQSQPLPRPPYAAGSAEAREAGRRGGSKRASTTALGSGIGLAKAFADPSFAPYRRAAENFARLHVRTLAQTVGGGRCSEAPASIVWSAGLQLAASRWAFEVAGDHVLGSRLANDSRQNLLAAHELCAREAQAKPRDTMAELDRRLGITPGGKS